MKARIVVVGLWACLVLAMPWAKCQTWIGDAFDLDTAVTLTHRSLPSDLSHLCLVTHSNNLFFMDQKAFQDAGNDYAAHICAISLQDYSSFEFDLPFPMSSKSRDWFAKTFWIKDLCFYEGLCAVSVQDHILLYHSTAPWTFVYDTILDHPNVKALYFYQNDLYYLEEDHDAGYRWYRFEFNKGKATLVRELRYEAPHVVQASPNRYLFHDENNVYFLNTRYPVVSRYALDGAWIEDLHFKLPDWHPFEDEYIRKSLEVPYGVERIFATKDQIFDYSYLKALYPIGDRYLIYYTQYDTVSKKSAPMYAISDATGHLTQYARQCPKDYLYTENRFPFNLFQPMEDLARTSWRDGLYELSMDGDVSWRNLTFDEYGKLKESFFRQQDPVLKVRVMRFKEPDMASQAFFYDTRRELYALDRLPEGKHVMIIHGGLECSACANYLSQAMNSLDSEQIHLGVLYAYIPGALQEREIHRNLKLFLTRPYNLYFLATDRMSQYPSPMVQKISRYPAVLFYETGRAPILCSDETIFADDPYEVRFSKTFTEMLERFMAK